MFAIQIPAVLQKCEVHPFPYLTLLIDDSVKIVFFISKLTVLLDFSAIEISTLLMNDSAS